MVKNSNKLIHIVILLLGVISSSEQVLGQCPYDNNFYLDITPSLCPGTASASCVYGGDYITTNVVQGNTYTWSTCGNSAFDTELTLYPSGGGPVLAYDDDDCGVQSSITWTATLTGTVDGLLDQFICNSNTTCMDINVNCELPPYIPNDSCISAIFLSLDSLILGTIENSTQSIPAILCNGITSSSANDAWYKFVADTTDLFVKVFGTPGLDAVIELLDSCGGNTLACADSTLVGGVEVIYGAGLTVGNTYYIRVYHNGGIPTTSTFYIVVTGFLSFDPPVIFYGVSKAILASSDSCFPLTVSGVGIINASYGLKTVCIEVIHSYDYFLEISLKSPDGTLIELTTNNGGGGDNYTNTCFGMYGSSDITDGIAPFSGLYIPEGDLGGVNNGQNADGTWELCIINGSSNGGLLQSWSLEFIANPSPFVLGNYCTGSISLSLNTVITASVDDKVQSIPPEDCKCVVSIIANDVWFDFNADAKDIFIVVYGSIGFDAVVELWDSCYGTLLSCVDDTYEGGTEQLHATDLILGNTYFVRVYNFDSLSTSTFDIFIYEESLPPNDDCAGAISLMVESTCAPVDGIANGTQSLYGCAGNAAGDVWYSFVASNPALYINVSGYSKFDAVVELLDGCSGNSLYCMDETYKGGSETIYASGLTVGSTYFIRVYDYDTITSQTIMFNICVSENQVIGTPSVYNSIGENLFVYPNPAQSEVTIRFSDRQDYLVLTLYDLKGQVLWNEPATGFSGYSYTLDISNYSSGIYFLQIKSNNLILTKKLVLNK